MIDYARAKAKRDSCFFFTSRHAGLPRQACVKIGHKRPFLAACYSCRHYAPRAAFFELDNRVRVTHQEKKTCTVCGGLLQPGVAVKKCSGQCKNNLLAYFPRKRIIIEEIQNEEDLYGVPLT